MYLIVRRRAFAVLALLVTSAFAVPGLALALPGQVTTEQKISSTAGGFSGTLDDNDLFGAAMASLGDLDGDGVADLVVGAPQDDDGGTNRGAVWVLFLNSSGTVKASSKISSTAGNFTGSLDTGDLFGNSVTSLGDLDGDGVTDIAVGAPFDDDGGTDRGAVWILLLNSNGTVKSQSKISSSTGGFGTGLDNSDEFGFSVASLGDVSGDSIPDLAVGAVNDDDGGTDRGAVWILFLNAGGAVGSKAKLSNLTAGLSGSIDDGDGFGSAVARIDDLNGDGVRDVAIGAVGDDDGALNAGAVYVVFLTNAGAVASVQKISATAGGFTGVLDASDMFGSALSQVRDLNDDGVNDLAVGAENDDDGASNAGAVWMLFLNTNGTVSLHRKISASLGGFTGPLVAGDNFGNALATPRDLNGDGVADLVVGAWRDDNGGTNRGAAYVLILDGVPGAFCGDGILDPAEDCDDGNQVTGDCCSATCLFDTSGTSCADNNLCNGSETCNASGTCLPGVPLSCDDGDLCTQDLCSPSSGCQATSGPASVCLTAPRAKIDLQDKPDDAADKLTWKWQKGEETLFTDFGQPNTSTKYALCVYDGESGAPVLEAKLVAPAGVNWSAAGNNGLKYRDKSGLSDGLTNILLKAGMEGKAKVQVKAKGLNLPMPIPEGPSAFFQQNPSVIVQLINSNGLCWTTEFTPPAATSNDARFKDAVP